MYKQRLVLFIFLFSVCTFSRLFSQIAANTASIGGCVPFNASYSAPPGATGISWNFGDQSGTTSSANGSHNYLTAGTYTCTYSATGGSPSSFTVVVHVYANPVANFAIAQPANNCVVKTVTITDQSTASSPISTWNWTYGDGGDSTLTTGGIHTYGYTLAGTYSISLIVTDIHGCYTQTTIGTIAVFPTPTAVIASNPSVLSACFPPFSVSYTSGVPAPAGATYSWNFGNSQTSTQMNPPGSITYTAAGSYTVNFTITSNGCSSTNTRVVTVNPPTLTAAVPSTVCLNAPFTVTVQSNLSSVFVNIGGGVGANIPASTTAAPHTVASPFTTTGVHTLTITAGSGTCSTVYTQTVYVDQVIASFTAAPPANSCASPFLVNYQNTSTPNATQFSWSYLTTQSVIVTATGASPTLTFTQGSLNPYTNYHAPYNLPFAPSVTMVATSPAGCIGTVVHVFDSITRPTASFYKSKQQGCAPLTVTLTNNSYTFTPNPIVSYTWCNGATPPVFTTGTGSNVLSPTFVYNNTGTYTPYLIIQTAGGCIDISFVDTVIVANPPVLNFSVSPATVCPNQPVQITNLTSLPTLTNVTHWHVDSDNGFFSGCISDPNPTWNFTHIGVHTFTMSGYVHGCKGTFVSPLTVTVNGPIVQGRYETNCTNRLSVNFYSDLQAAPNATLNFGDNSPPKIITTGNNTGTATDLATHVYTATGNYTATLIGTNPTNTCSPSIYTMVVTVRDINANILSPAVGCLNVSTVFSGATSVDVFTSCNRGYVWYVDNFPPVDNSSATFGPVFTTTGVHTVTLMVKDINSCSDTAITTVRISSVTPAFSFATPTICVNTGVQLINTSTSISGDPITSSNWSFEAGQTLQSPGVSSPTHTYTTSPSFTSTVISSLTVTNVYGCSATVSHPIIVVRPDASFYPSPYNFCIGASAVTVTFVAVPTNQSYTWDFGASPSSTLTSTSNTATYSYSQAGSYNIVLKVKDANQCQATSTSIVINAQQTPTANFAFTSPKSTGGNVICSPAKVNFRDSSISVSPIVSYNWNLGSGTSVLPQPSVALQYTNTTNTTIVVSLTVSTSLGCMASETKTFSLYTPKADIVASKTAVCLGDPITFNIKDTTGRGILAWNWDFGPNNSTDTVLANSSPPSFTAQPFNTFSPPTGDIQVSLIYYSSQFGCKDAAKLNIRVIKVDANFKRNNELTIPDSVHCVNIQDTFYNNSPSTSASPSWSFGDGTTSSGTSPTHTYPLPGIYQVSLTVVGEQSCKGLTVKNMTINALPVAHITSKDSICKDASLILTGAGTSTAGITGYQWSPALEVDNPTSANTTATARDSTRFSLVVTDGNGCVSKPVAKNIYIQQPASPIQWDTTVIVGQHVPMSAYAGNNYTYAWNPVSNLSCTNCAQPVSSSTVNITYSVEVADNLGCFRVTDTFTVNIDPETSVDVPTAFTPNGDGTNDIIYVAGWGIKKLNYFRIYNRWGQLLFESNDIKIGWDGVYNGVPQNMETYVYQVSVMTYLDKKDLIKTSSFRLIR